MECGSRSWKNNPLSPYFSVVPGTYIAPQPTEMISHRSENVC
jgi:hypothetical protein